MRKVISFTHASLDGYVAGPNDEMDWIVYNHEMELYAEKLCQSVDAAVYGRRTYELMYGYWPTVLGNPNATPHELKHAEWVENIQKVVFSTTMDRAEWNNTLLIKENLTEEVMKLKQQPGRDMLIFGSPRLTHTLAALGLVDQYRVNVNPVAIGEGIPLFDPKNGTVKLSLLEKEPFECGVVGLRYEVVR
jgi:dihydrofolate reductase